MKYIQVTYKDNKQTVTDVDVITCDKYIEKYLGFLNDDQKETIE